jgi:hypothetical protein
MLAIQRDRELATTATASLLGIEPRTIGFVNRSLHSIRTGRDARRRLASRACDLSQHALLLHDELPPAGDPFGVVMLANVLDAVEQVAEQDVPTRGRAVVEPLPEQRIRLVPFLVGPRAQEAVGRCQLVVELASDGFSRRERELIPELGLES